MSDQESRRAYQWVGHEVVGLDGAKIGRVDAIYVDDRTDRPEWVAVKIGVFGGRISFVPIRGAKARGDALQVGYDKAAVQGSPTFSAGRVLSVEEVDQLYAHYGLPGGHPTEQDGRNDSTLADEVRGDGAVEGSAADLGMLRSEEQVRIGVEQREAGRVRLRKYVVTEAVDQAVPVRLEELHVERHRLSDADRRALGVGELSEEELIVRLYGEEVLTEKQVVARERVRVDKQVITEQQEVSTEVRKEVVDAEHDVVARRPQT